MATISLPVRVDAELARNVKEIAQRHKVSANRILTEAIEAYVKAEKEREWRESFEAMANDPDAGELEGAIDLVSEALDLYDALPPNKGA